MNIQETLALIEGLKQAGAKHFKSADFEITLEHSQGSPIPKEQIQDPIIPATENKEATEKIKDLIGTLNMTDTELAEKMFPDGGPA